MYVVSRKSWQPRIEAPCVGALLLCGIWVYVVCGHLVYVYSFWYIVPRKIWQPRSPLRRCVIISPPSGASNHSSESLPGVFVDVEEKRVVIQGCQIFLGTTYQYVEKYTKKP
jgi:hypothetical protein